LLFLASFLSTLAGIIAYHGIVAFRERWYRKESIEDDIYYSVEGASTKLGLENLRT